MKLFNRIFGKKANFDSKEYWEKRYQYGGNSGSGSYSNLSVFKAEIINDIVLLNNIDKVIEFGVGDGHQLTLMNYKRYLGLDVSPSVIKLCINKFSSDPSKSFILYDNNCFSDSAGFIEANLSLSLDVLYHLVEAPVYEKYLIDLFSVADKMVVIYSTNEELPQFGGHEKHRVITRDIERLIPGWKLSQEIKNKYPVAEHGEEMGSRANFYIFIKKQLA